MDGELNGGPHMNKDCSICRWGPKPSKCLLDHCVFSIIDNAEGLRRLSDKGMEEWLGLSQLWLKKSLDNGLEKILIGESKT
jgi:hypothetical protein